jgi:hypothetical protein
MRRLKTPPYDLTQLREIAFLILCYVVEFLEIHQRSIEDTMANMPPATLPPRPMS